MNRQQKELLEDMRKDELRQLLKSKILNERDKQAVRKEYNNRRKVTKLTKLRRVKRSQLHNFLGV